MTGLIRIRPGRATFTPANEADANSWYWADIDEMAEERGVPPDQLRKMAREQGWHEAIRSELVDRRALELLAEAADVEEVSASASD